MEQRIADKILSIAVARKADAAEVYLRTSASTTVEVKDRKVDAFERARDVGVGLRVLSGGRMGFAFTAVLEDSALRGVVDDAFANARGSSPDPHLAIPGRPADPFLPVEVHDPAVASLSDSEKIERAMDMEREAFAADRRIKRIRKASASFGESTTVIRNSFGADVQYRGTIVSADIEVVAEDQGEAQAGWEHDVRRFLGSIDTVSIGRRAARKALDLLGARHIDSLKAPVILDPGVAEEFLSIMASGLSAESVQKKRSLFMGKLGTEVVSPVITVVDDGLLEGGIGTAPADDEAVPLRRKTVISGGRLEMLLYNTHAANRDGTVSTGNAVRGGFKGVPGIGVTNLFIEPGKSSPDEIIAATGRGLFVNEVMGMHTANPISGDFSVGATGFWIEDGRKAYPVREVTIAGNILDLMRNVDLVGSDLRFFGRIGSPSLRIKQLSIGGK